MVEVVFFENAVPADFAVVVFVIDFNVAETFQSGEFVGFVLLHEPNLVSSQDFVPQQVRVMRSENQLRVVRVAFLRIENLDDSLGEQGMQLCIELVYDERVPVG